MASARIIFVTGTDTGVGKTLFTGLLLAHLREAGAPTLALKPFCSGTRADAELLASIQDGVLPIEEVNPYYYPEPVAPLVADRGRGRSIDLRDAVAKVQSIAKRLSRSHIQGSKLVVPPCLLVEGSGGLLVPLGEGYSVLDLILAIHCHVIVLSRNKLGTLNHTLLTVRELTRSLGRRHRSEVRVQVVLMDTRDPDPSCRSNPRILSELLAPVPVVSLPWLGLRLHTPGAIRSAARKLKRVLSRVAILALQSPKPQRQAD